MRRGAEVATVYGSRRWQCGGCVLSQHWAIDQDKSARIYISEQWSGFMAET